MVFNTMIWMGRVMFLIGIVTAGFAVTRNYWPLMVVGVALTVAGIQLSARGRELLAHPPQPGESTGTDEK